MKTFLPLLLALLIVGCAEQPQAPQKAEYGHLDYYPAFETSHFTPRDVLVWLPEDYNPKERYGVLYMHDGQMLFDRATSWNNQSWEIDSLAHAVISDKRTAPFIVVGIDNCDSTRLFDYMPRRVFDYLPSEELQRYNTQAADFRSDDYLKFLVEELKPFIDSHYPTYPDAAHTATAGSSAGGLISLYAICEYPEVFGAAACLSTHTPMVIASLDQIAEAAPVWSKALRDYIAEHQPTPNSVKIYMDCGDQTLDSLYPHYQQKVDSLFHSHGWNDNNYQSRVFAGHHHDENSWKRRFDIPLQFIFAPKAE
ncbi:MAG: alpha/beta hydrolase-fold protein [Rikenellaceae bacterium]|nr:alpha/beta hydrolase-fold protein [Rikenellaceae bacterium]